jgi:hypothetical protein
VKVDEVQLSLTGVLARAVDQDCENEDLRSVIDDLTIESKRLKTLLHEP